MFILRIFQASLICYSNLIGGYDGGKQEGKGFQSIFNLIIEILIRDKYRLQSLWVVYT